jgi:hypothetical protein
MFTAGGLGTRPQGSGTSAESNEPLRLNVSELVVNRAAKVNRLLSERHAPSAVNEVPFEDRESDTVEPMHVPVGIDDQLEWDVV